MFGIVNQMMDQTGLIRIKPTIKEKYLTKLDLNKSPNELFHRRSFLPPNNLWIAGHGRSQ